MDDLHPLSLEAFDTLSIEAEEAGDYRRHELVDCRLLVWSTPDRGHQRAVTRVLEALFDATRTRGWSAQPGSDLRTATSVLCPDIHLVPRDNDEAPPSLVVEVTSAETRAVDLGAKREAYAAMGIPAYWVLDRDRRALIVHILDQGAYPPPVVHDETARVVVAVPIGTDWVDVTLDIDRLLG